MEKAIHKIELGSLGEDLKSVGEEGNIMVMGLVLELCSRKTSISIIENHRILIKIFLLFVGHTLLLSGVTPGSVLRNSS